MKSVAFVVGTTAEVIKVSGVVTELTAIGIKCEIWSTQQQAVELEATLKTFFGESPIKKLSNSQTSLSHKIQVIPWACSNFSSIVRLRFARDKVLPDGIIVQGDTLSTVIGALAGKLLSLPVVHLEAGLRSGDWRNPFPEELNRRYVSRIASLHLAPNLEACANLSKSKGIVLNTFGNTGIDALKNIFQMVTTNCDTVSKSRTSVTVVLHRTELLSRKDVFAETISALDELSLEFDVTLTLDVPSAKALSELNRTSRDKDSSKLKSVQKLEFPMFVELLSKTDFVITDSGGLQEECAILGIPCFIHREVSERQDGIGENAALTGMDVAKLKQLTKNWEQYKRQPQWPTSSPSKKSALAITKLLD